MKVPWIKFKDKMVGKGFQIVSLKNFFKFVTESVSLSLITNGYAKMFHVSI